MERWSVIGTGLLFFGVLASSAVAAGPSKADMDFCNQKAAQAAKPSPVQPGTGSQPAKPPVTGMQADENKPGTPVSPGQAVQPAPPASQSGSNPSGGRVTDSSPPGTPPSELGMAAIGETDPAYRQMYLACISD